MSLKSLIPLAALLIVTGCGGANSSSVEPGTGANRGGPDSLSGTAWKAEPITANGIQLALSFSFERDKVTATNTCDGTLTATTSTPVRYLYTARVAKPVQKREESGNAHCEVSIAAGEISFEVKENKLFMTFQGETVSFNPKGGVAGLYGTWTADAPGVGTLEWSLGDGKLFASAICDSGLTARVETPAEFTNILEILENANMRAGEGSSRTCDVAISKGKATYAFDGDALVLTQNGSSIRFARR